MEKRLANRQSLLRWLVCHVDRPLAPPKMIPDVRACREALSGRDTAKIDAALQNIDQQLLTRGWNVLGLG